MTATTADRAGARAESHGGGNSDALGRRDRPTPARTSAISLFVFLRAEFIERPRIFRLDRLGPAEIKLGAIGHGNAGQRLAGLVSLFDHLADAWPSRLALAARLCGRGVEAESFLGCCKKVIAD